jgi:aminopeptidase 2
VEGDRLTKEQMSTYLLAFANGEFVHLESSYKSPLSGKTRPLRIYSMSLPSQYSYLFSCPPATPDVIGQAQYALDIKRLALPHYEKAFDIEYPLPKLDTLVANDFDAGAMENWVIAIVCPRPGINSTDRRLRPTNRV